MLVPIYKNLDMSSFIGVSAELTLHNCCNFNHQCGRNATIYTAAHCAKAQLTTLALHNFVKLLKLRGKVNLNAV
jgi:hypothetical protein